MVWIFGFYHNCWRQGLAQLLGDRVGDESFGENYEPAESLCAFAVSYINVGDADEGRNLV